MGDEAAYLQPDGGDQDARPASQTATTALVVEEE
jgi:hypothetical protein